MGFFRISALSVPSKATVTFSPSGAAYGSQITITATAQKRDTANYLRSAAVGRADFWLGNIGPGQKLGTALVNENGDGTATASLTIPKYKWGTDSSHWTIGNNDIPVDFGGNAVLLESQGSGTQTVRKSDYEVEAPGVKADKTKVKFGGTPPGITKITGLDGNPAVTYSAVASGDNGNNRPLCRKNCLQPGN